MFLVVCDSITFSYHSLNIVVLLLTSPKFKSELKHLFPMLFKFSENDSNTNSNAKINNLSNSQMTNSTNANTNKLAR